MYLICKLPKIVSGGGNLIRLQELRNLGILAALVFFVSKKFLSYTHSWWSLMRNRTEIPVLLFVQLFSPVFFFFFSFFIHWLQEVGCCQEFCCQNSFPCFLAMPLLNFNYFLLVLEILIETVCRSIMFPFFSMKADVGRSLAVLLVETSLSYLLL